MDDKREGGAAVGGYQQAIRGLRWIGSARLMSQVITWSLTVLTVRLLRPVDYGIVATAGLFTVTAALLLDSGLNAVLISWKDMTAEIQGAAASMVMLLSLALAIVIMIMAPAAGRGFRDPALVSALRVAALQLPVSGLTVVPLAALLRKMSFRRIALCQSVSGICQGLFTLAMAYLGEAYWALIWGTIFGYAMRAVLLWISLDAPLWPNLRFGELRPLLGSGIQMLGHRLLQYVSGDCDIFALGWLQGATILGPYSLAKNLSQSILDLLADTVSQVAVPSFAAKRDDMDAQTSGLILMISTAATLVFPSFWLMSAISQLALPLIFGARWIPVVFPFVAFTFMLPVRSIYGLLDSAIIGLGENSMALKNAITRGATMIPLIATGAWFGVKWAAIAWVVGFPIVFLSAVLRISRRFRVKRLTLLRPLGPPALSAGAAWLVVAGVSALLQGALPPVVVLVLVGCLGLLCYVCLIRLIGRSHYLQVASLAQQLIRR